MKRDERDELVILTEQVKTLSTHIKEVKDDVKEILDCTNKQSLLIQTNKDKIKSIEEQSSRDLKILGIFLTIVFSVISIILKWVT